MGRSGEHGHDGVDHQLGHLGRQQATGIDQLARRAGDLAGQVTGRRSRHDQVKAAGHHQRRHIEMMQRVAQHRELGDEGPLLDRSAAASRRGSSRAGCPLGRHRLEIAEAGRQPASGEISVHQPGRRVAARLAGLPSR